MSSSQRCYVAFSRLDIFCDSEAIRTLDPRLRRALLYPAELRNPFCGGKGNDFFFLPQELFVEIY